MKTRMRVSEIRFTLPENFSFTGKEIELDMTPFWIFKGTLKVLDRDLTYLDNFTRIQATVFYLTSHSFPLIEALHIKGYCVEGIIYITENYTEEVDKVMVWKFVKNNIPFSLKYLVNPSYIQWLELVRDDTGDKINPDISYNPVGIVINNVNFNNLLDNALSKLL